MLTKDELEFINYWSVNREQQRSLKYQLRSGMPLGILFIITVLIIVLSGWYKRAAMILNGSSYIITIMIALLIVAVGFAVFYKRAQWDRKEQYYLELAAKKKKQEKNKEM